MYIGLQKLKDVKEPEDGKAYCVQICTRNSNCVTVSHDCVVPDSKMQELPGQHEVVSVVPARCEELFDRSEFPASPQRGTGYFLYVRPITQQAALTLLARSRAIDLIPLFATEDYHTFLTAAACWC